MSDVTARVFVKEAEPCSPGKPDERTFLAAWIRKRLGRLLMQGAGWCAATRTCPEAGAKVPGLAEGGFAANATS